MTHIHKKLCNFHWLAPNCLRRVLNYGAVAQWYSQRTTVLEVAGSIPAPVIVELL